MKLVFDLNKALDKTKLVQVERQVQGKNGVFTRKQWVKPSDVKDSDRVIGGQPNVAEDTAKPYQLKYYIDIDAFKEKYAKALGIPASRIKLGGRTLSGDEYSFQVYNDDKHYGAHSHPQKGYDLGEIVINPKNKTMQIRKPAFGDVDSDTLGKAKKAMEDSRVNSSQKAPTTSQKNAPKSSADKPVNIDDFKFTDYKNPDGQNTANRKTYKSAMKDWAEQTEKVFERTLKNYWGNTPPEKQLQTAFRNLNSEASIRDLVSNSSEAGLKEARDAISARQGKLLEMAKKYTKWDSSKREWVEDSSTSAKDSAEMTQETFDKKYPNGNMQDPEECLKNNGSNATWHGEKLQNPSVMKKAKEEYKQFQKDKKALEQSKKKGDDKSPTKGDTVVTNFKNGFVRYNPDGEKPPYHGGKTYKYFASRKDDTTGKYFDSQKEAEDYVNGDKADDSKALSGKNVKFTAATSGRWESDKQVIDAAMIKPNGDAVSSKSSKYVIIKDGDKYKLYQVGLNHKQHLKSAKSLDEAVKFADAQEDKATADKTYNGVKIKSNSSGKFQVLHPDDGSVVFTGGSEDQAKHFIDTQMPSYKSDKSKSSDTKSGTFDSAEFTKLKADRPKAMQYLKDNGITWKESDKDGINWMRACMAATKASNSAQGATNNTSASKSSSDSKTAGKSSEEAKKAVKDLLSAHGNDRAKVMSAAKASGVTWKESDNAGINWMRASLAIQKHHESGKTVDATKSSDSTKSDDKKSDNKTQNSGKTANRSVLYEDDSPLHNSKAYNDIIDKLSEDDAKKLISLKRKLTQSVKKQDWKTLNSVGREYEKLEQKLGLRDENGHVLGSKDYPEFKDPKPTHDNPLITSDTKSGQRYQIWENNGKIYGSLPGKQDSRNVRDVTDFSAAGFKNLDEVKDYIKKYF